MNLTQLHAFDFVISHNSNWINSIKTSQRVYSSNSSSPVY